MITNKLVISGNKNFLQACHDALAPEAGEEEERASYKIKLGRRSLVNSEEVLTIEVEGQDYVAFRAVMTSVLSILAIVDKTFKQID